MDSLSHLFDEFAAPSYEPTAEDMAEWCDYLDSIGYDDDGDDCDYDPDAGYSFQNLDNNVDWETPW
jgi:hypothetical protein